MEKDDDLWDDDYTDWKFHSLLCEMERNGKILEQWESGAPIVDGDNAPKKETKKKTDEKETAI